MFMNTTRAHLGVDPRMNDFELGWERPRPLVGKAGDEAARPQALRLEEARLCSQKENYY